MAIGVRINAILRPLQFIWLSVTLHYETFKEAVRKDGLLASLKQLQSIREAAMAKLFIMSSDGFIAFENTTVVDSLVRCARGKILELGPGPGNQIQRFDPSIVDVIYAVEPNPSYGAHIAAKARKLGLQDKYKVLLCGVEDSEILRADGVTEGSIDTILSIQVLCSVGDVNSIMKEIWKLLKPGGSFVFWEHESSPNTVTAVMQACLNPPWSTFVGCHMNRNIKSHILAAGEWENPRDIQTANDAYNVLPRIWGVLKKKA